MGIRGVTGGTNTFAVGFGKGSYTVRGFSAVKGYDRASGWGTLDIANFIPAFLAPDFSRGPARLYSWSP